jgi:L,D-transpeptidase-like protein/putative peptidoglycan binding protein
MMVSPMRTKLFFVPFVVGLVLAGPVAAASPVHAHLLPGVPAAASVTLKASPTTVTYGKSVTFSGKISPASGGEIVRIFDQNGDQIAHAATAADGTYQTHRIPPQNLAVHAEWTTAASTVVHLFVRPILHGKRSPILPFAKVHVTGRLIPASATRTVSVTLSQNGNTLKRVPAHVGNRGRFSTYIQVDHLGSQRVVVYERSRHFARTAWRSNPGTPPTPGLHQGSTGLFVQLLQGRLMQLHYHVAGRNGNFDYRTADSVMAFHKVQGMVRTTYVDAATWRALADPKSLVPRVKTTGSHWEVNLTKQVAFYVVNGKVRSIFHVSSGKPSTPTFPGQFHVDQKVPGYNQKEMYYSSFFDGNRALHGYADVPPYAASHGCVRMPIWSAIWVYNHAPLGILVDVYY